MFFGFYLSSRRPRLVPIGILQTFAGHKPSKMAKGLDKSLVDIILMLSIPPTLIRNKLLLFFLFLFFQ